MTSDDVLLSRVFPLFEDRNGLAREVSFPVYKKNEQRENKIENCPKIEREIERESERVSLPFPSSEKADERERKLCSSLSKIYENGRERVNVFSFLFFLTMRTEVNEPCPLCK